MDPQLAIRQQAEDYRDYLRSLNDWQQEIREKEAQVTQVCARIMSHDGS